MLFDAFILEYLILLSAVGVILPHMILMLSTHPQLQA